MATRTGDRERPGRLTFLAVANLDAAIGVAASVVLVVVTRLPFMTRYLLNWDAVQFALGTRHFDLVHHQPHPPGYIGYIGLGKLAQLLLPDPNAALVAISIVAEAGAAAVAFLFARRLFGLYEGWAASLALVTSPLFWYYGEAANTYALEPLLTLVVAWFAWRVWNGHSGSAIPAGLALALAGALRPSTAVFLTPVFLLALVRTHDVRIVVTACFAAVLATLTWLLPLLALSGGVRAYLAASIQLGGSVSTGTAIWERGLDGLQVTTDAVARGIGWELGFFGIPLLIALAAIPLFLWRRPQLPTGWALFCAAWTLPALVTFLFVHIGQVVYVQVFTCALVVTVGPALRVLARWLRRPSPRLLLACACALNVVSFVMPPRYSLQGQLLVHDVYVSDLVGFGSALDPRSTVFLTYASGASSYRLSQFYLPDFHRVAVGRDRRGKLGEIYGDSYDLTGFQRARTIETPTAADEYVLLDRGLIDEYVADPERLHVVWFSYGERVYVWHGPAPRLESGELWFGSRYHERRGVA